MMDWTKPEDNVTGHFTVADCLTLHHWKRLATAADGADFGKLADLCWKLEEIRLILAWPMNVHCMFRSPAYNLEIGAPAHDVHSLNLACDFDCEPHLTCDQIKNLLLPRLATLGIRMENNGLGATWVHVDLHPVIHARYFLP